MTPARRDPVAAAIRLGYTPLAFACLFSFGTNLLYLSLPIYMNQLYERIIPSQSQSTLAVLTLGVAFCFVIVGVLEDLRNRVLQGFGSVFDHLLSGHVFAALFDVGLRATAGTRAQGLRDLDTLRQTLQGSAVVTLLDAPWSPIYLIALFIIDPIIGGITLFGGVVLVGLALVQHRATRRLLQEANDATLRSYSFTEASLRNAEVVRGLGMLPGLAERWARDRRLAVDGHAKASEWTSKLGAAARVVRVLIQVAVLAAGAYLVLARVIGPGILFANMILSSRALGPVERLVATWNTLMTAKQARDRLTELFSGYEPQAAVTALPRPEGHLAVEGVGFVLPGTRKVLLRNVKFEIQAGETLGVIGASGAGKSTLVRLLVGIWPPSAGTVRLDGADIYAWDRVSLGRHIGYMPQDVELFAGSVRDNIARFRSDVPDDDVIQAAQSAGVHDMILKLPQGYDTPLSEGGATLSVGQRQRLGLARALLGTPTFVVLDEPNANLDSEGEAALLAAIETLRAQRATVVIVSHRPSVFRLADKIVVLRDGQVDRFGPRDAILSRPVQASAAPPPPAKIAAIAE